MIVKRLFLYGKKSVFDNLRLLIEPETMEDFDRTKHNAKLGKATKASVGRNSAFLHF